MFVLIAIAAFFVLMFLSEISESRSTSDSNSLPDENSSPQHYHQVATHYYPPDPYFHPRGPIFSPDRRYIWDGEKWVENESHFGAGIIIGVVLALVIVFVVL